ncbi:MAG TPA: response regulator transcription factor [Nitratifractor sp.]|nr:response regulator transcription factor [Nitratifractor sp.]
MVEDDEELADIIYRFLLKSDIYLDNVTSGAELLERLKSSSKKYELLILDLTLPDIDGLDLIQKIRQISDIPIIISSARDDILDKIKGFENGADDYMPKPYDPRELEARIKSVIARYKSVKKPCESLFELKEDEHLILFHNQPLQLTLAQFDVLALLIKRNGGVVSREDMIYSSSNIDDSSTLKNIDVIISYIRKKLKAIDKREYIQSVRGLGYKLLTNLE